MEFIAELKRKADYCDFGDRKESLICDKVINGIRDQRCAERLLDIPDSELTLDRVIQVCRQCELTQMHMKATDPKNNNEVAQVNRTQTRGRGRARGRGRSTPRGRGGYQGSDPYCDKCGKHHGPNRCPAFHKTCDVCHQKEIGRAHV